MIYDIAIIGAGIAGASLAAELGAHASVLLLEMEDAPGYHTTGRSAAFWSETYGGPAITPLTTASGDWLRAHGLLAGHGEVHIGRAEDEAAMAAFEQQYTGDSGVTFVRLDPRTLVPGLRQDWCLGLAEPSCADIDVGGLHGHYLSAVRKSGAPIICRAEVESAARDTQGWSISTRAGTYQARILVNAAGAWADVLAQRSGVRPVGITPLRRTMVQLRMAEPLPEKLPIIVDINGQFYFKPEGQDRLWLSPHDEIPSSPCDAAPEELDIAIAIDRFESVVDWKIAVVERRWAGLRSFAPDRLPVFGFDPRVGDFFWFAGQGGFGIQTAPAAAKLGAAVLLGHAPDPMVASIDARRFSPARFK
jgi:D-arginine dehydrogenase